MSDGKLFKKTTIITITPDDLRTIVWQHLVKYYYDITPEDIQFNAQLNGYSIPVLRDCTVKIVEEET